MRHLYSVVLWRTGPEDDNPLYPVFPPPPPHRRTADSRPDKYQPETPRCHHRRPACAPIQVAAATAEADVIDLKISPVGGARTVISGGEGLDCRFLRAAHAGTKGSLVVRPVRLHASP